MCRIFEIMPARSAALLAVAIVQHIIQPSEQYFFNGIKSGLDEDLRHSLFLSYVGQCRWQRDLAVFLGDMRIVQRSNTHYVVSGVLVVRRNLTDPLSATVKIEICQNSTHCRPFFEPAVDVGNVCGFLRDQRNSSLGAILALSVPPLECPLRKAVYRINDALVDYRLFRYFSPHVSKFWRVDFTGESGCRRAFCLRIEFYVYSWEDMLPRY